MRGGEYENVSSQICEEPSLLGGRGKNKNAQIVPKHILILEFLKSDEILKIGTIWQVSTDKQGVDTIVSR